MAVSAISPSTPRLSQEMTTTPAGKRRTSGGSPPRPTEPSLLRWPQALRDPPEKAEGCRGAHTGARGRGWGAGRGPQVARGERTQAERRRPGASCCTPEAPGVRRSPRPLPCAQSAAEGRAHDTELGPPLLVPAGMAGRQYCGACLHRPGQTGHFCHCVPGHRAQSEMKAPAVPSPRPHGSTPVDFRF